MENTNNSGLKIITSFSDLSNATKKWLKQNKADGKQIISVVSGKKLLGFVSYSHTASNECFIHSIGSGKRSALWFTKLFGEPPESALLKLLIQKGVRTFDYGKIAKKHHEIIEEWKKLKMIEYDKNWKFAVTDYGVECAKNRSSFNKAIWITQHLKKTLVKKSYVKKNIRKKIR